MDDLVDYSHVLGVRADSQLWFLAQLLRLLPVRQYMIILLNMLESVIRLHALDIILFCFLFVC